MSGISGKTLRAWRRSRGWDVPKVARRFRQAAGDDPLPAHDALVRMIYRWERGEHALSERYELLYRALGLGEADGASQAGDAIRSRERDGAEDAAEVMAWVTGTNTSDDTIEQLDRAARYLAETHAHIPARRILSEVLGLHRQAQSFLRGGRQRFRQTRNLLRIDSALLAHACVLLGDLGREQAARDYGTAALLLAQEAEADQAMAWSAQAKTARWQGRYVEAAELARRGFEISNPTPVRVELAYREANAIALFGDASRARESLRRAQRAAETVDQDDTGSSVWSFAAGRQAIFSLSVAIHTGDPAAALRAAADADSCWNSGDPKVPATWAQVRAGAAMAHLMLDSLDRAAEEIAPVLELAPELRIQTITGYLEDVQQILRQPRFAGSGLAAGLQEQIREFNSAPAA